MSEIFSNGVQEFFMSNFSNEMPQISLGYFVNLLTTLKSQIDGVSEIEDLWIKFIPQVKEKYESSLLIQDSDSISDVFINLILNDLAISIIENKIIKDVIITPWDINNGIRNSEVLSSIFPNSTSQTFQVEIRHNNEIYNADIEEEFAFGYLTFVLNFLPNELHNNTIFINNIPLQLLSNGLMYNRYIINQDIYSKYQYSCVINNNTYIFNTILFMKGFNTALLLFSGTEENTYLTDIKEYLYNDDEVSVKDLKM
jgi:hypothetical protein